MMDFPPNPVQIVLWLVALLLMMLFGGSGDRDAPPSDGRSDDGNTYESLTVIESVEVLVLESYPYQLNLVVAGYQPDGCIFPVNVEQRREGSRVYLKIYRVMPIDVMCTMQLVPYNATIRLEGGFENGQYTIDVNGTVVEVQL
jgi:inhibitor of cysteine peptidase